jgi:hypothetical protein
MRLLAGLVRAYALLVAESVDNSLLDFQCGVREISDDMWPILDKECSPAGLQTRRLLLCLGHDDGQL